MAEHFGPYELIKRIAVGGMAEVFLARSGGAQGFSKQLVIKRILPHLNQDPDFVEMFVREARLAARLQHANIVQILDFDEVEGTRYIAMEHVEGADLRRISSEARRKKHPIPGRVAVHIGVETLKGLHIAHQGDDPIVHRDISPHNLLLSYAGEVKVADFGIAKVASQHTLTRTGMLKGKLGYMAPEQVRGDPVDARTDLFALGVVLWELCAGRRAYEHARSEGELLAAARLGSIAALDKLAPDLDPGLATIVMRLVAPEPAGRYGSAREALAELDAFAKADGVLETARYLERLLPVEERRRTETPVTPRAQKPALEVLEDAPRDRRSAGPRLASPAPSFGPRTPRRRQVGRTVLALLALCALLVGGLAGYRIWSAESDPQPTGLKTKPIDVSRGAVAAEGERPLTDRPDRAAPPAKRSPRPDRRRARRRRDATRRTSTRRPRRPEGQRDNVAERDQEKDKKHATIVIVPPISPPKQSPPSPQNPKPKAAPATKPQAKRQRQPKKPPRALEEGTLGWEP